MYIDINRTAKTRFGEAVVAGVALEDDAQKISLNLWKFQISLAKGGDLGKVENRFVRTYRDQLELNAGSRREKQLPIEKRALDALK